MKSIYECTSLSALGCSSMNVSLWMVLSAYIFMSVLHIGLSMKTL